MKDMTFSILVVFTILFTSCQVFPTSDVENDELRYTISKSEYTRDSSFINYTVLQFIEKKYNEYAIDSYTSAAKVHVDTILYSPEGLKLFSLIIVEKAEGEEDKPFHGRAVIAYRENLNEAWKVYPINKFVVSFGNYEGARNVLRRSYFEELKGMKDNKSNKFKYSLGESGFWNDLFFKKGLDVDSLYYFQTELNRNTPTSKRIRDGVVPYLEIEYPQEILDLYK